jgi:hypothetical protein
VHQRSLGQQLDALGLPAARLGELVAERRDPLRVPARHRVLRVDRARQGTQRAHRL